MFITIPMMVTSTINRVSMVASTRRLELVSMTEHQHQQQQHQQLGNEGISTRGQQLYTTTHPLKCHQGKSAHKQQNAHDPRYQTGPLSDPWFWVCHYATASAASASASASATIKWRRTCPCSLSRTGSILLLLLITIIIFVVNHCHHDYDDDQEGGSSQTYHLVRPDHLRSSIEASMPRSHK